MKFTVKKLFPEIEKHIIRIGALLGVVATILLIRAEFVRFKAPNLEIFYLASQGHEINFAPLLNENKTTFSMKIPFGIVVHNNGNDVARNVLLSLIMDKGMQIGAKKIPSEIYNMMIDDGFRKLIKLKLGDINPGDNISLMNIIWVQVRDLRNITAKPVFNGKEGEPLPLDSIQLSYDIEARITSENSELKTIYLLLNTAMEDYFIRKDLPYCTYSYDGQFSYHPNDIKKKDDGKQNVKN